MASNRDRNHTACITMLHAEGRYFATLSAPTIKDYKNRVVETGWADISAAYRGRAAYIECKADHHSDPLSFSLDNWREDQREWAKWVRSVTENEYWIFLTMGSGRVNAANNPDRSWLVPYEAWLYMESQVRPIQATLVYEARKHHRTEIQERHLDAITLLAKYAVQWKSRWWIPDEHPFHQMYLANETATLYHIETGAERHVIHA